MKPGDYLLVEDNDRLSRQDWLTACNFLRDIVGKGVVVVTLSNGNEIDKQRFERDPGCFLPVVLRSHLGHDENEKKSERIKASWEARKLALRNGKAANMHLPCWLGWDKEAKKPVLVESNAKVIRRMFELALQSLGCQTIARRLHQEGEKLVVKGKRHDRRLTISAPYVWRTLRNKLAIGYGVYVQPPQPGVYPPVVDEKTFYTVQTRLQENKRQTVPRAHSEASLVTGLARCSKCRGTLCRFTQCRKKTYQYLVCSDTLHKHGKCGMSSIRYDRFEQSFLSLLAHGQLLRAILTDRQEEPSVLDTLKGRLADAQAQADKYLKLIDGDDNPSRRLSDALKVAEGKEAELQSQVEAEEAKARTVVPAAQVYHACCDLFGRGLKPEDRGTLRQALRDFVEKVVVRLGDDSYDVHFKGGKLPITVDVNCTGWTFDPAPTVEAYAQKVAALGIS